MGKETLSDLQQGNITAPILFTLLHYKTEKEYPQLKEILKERRISKSNVLIVDELMRKTDSLEMTRRLAVAHVNKAMEGRSEVEAEGFGHLG